MKHSSRSASAKREAHLLAPKTASSRRRKRRKTRRRRRRRKRNRRRTSRPRGIRDRVHAPKARSEPRDGCHLSATNGRACPSATGTSTSCRKGRSFQRGRLVSRSVTLSLSTRSSSCKERQAPERLPRCPSSCLKLASQATKTSHVPSQGGWLP